MVRFIPPYPLLLTSDSAGQVYIWLTKPHPDAGTCIVNWRNNYTLKSNSPITAIDTFCDANKFLLLIGDEMGTVRIQDISAIRTQKKIVIDPVDLQRPGRKEQRNPYRIIEMKHQSHEVSQMSTDNQIYEVKDGRRDPVVKESEIIQISQWSAHTDAVKSIQYISETDKPLVLTASLDKFVHIFSVEGELLGTLKQGYMNIRDYKWEFNVT